MRAPCPHATLVSMTARPYPPGEDGGSTAVAAPRWHGGHIAHVCCSRLAAAPCAPQDNDAYHDIETDATSGAGRRMMARAGKATIMLAALAICFGFRGAIAARVGNPKDMGEYVGYKALFLALTLCPHGRILVEQPSALC